MWVMNKWQEWASEWASERSKHGQSLFASNAKIFRIFAMKIQVKRSQQNIQPASQSVNLPTYTRCVEECPYSLSPLPLCTPPRSFTISFFFFPFLVVYGCMCMCMCVCLCSLPLYILCMWINKLHLIHTYMHTYMLFHYNETQTETYREKGYKHIRPMERQKFNMYIKYYVSLLLLLLFSLPVCLCVCMCMDFHKCVYIFV